MHVDHHPNRVARIGRHRRAGSKLAGITAFMQPIMALSSGRIVGFEALARLRDGNTLLRPARFMPGLSEADRLELFCEILGQAGRFITSARKLSPTLFVSVNVETSILMRDDLSDLVEESAVGMNDAIYLELLESEKIVDFDKACMNLIRLKELGFGISLDDVGSAYSSLIMLKRLPIDVIKLDQVFARELRRKPSDLQFVHSVVSLARGLGKKLVVEGVETPEIQEALAILGVDYGQGYAIAKPMPDERALEWLKEHRETTQTKFPSSLIGCYAAHLNVVETCQMLALQPLPMSWHRDAKNPHACGIGAYFDRLGLHDTPYGLAHKAFHMVLADYRSDPVGWESAAERFRCELKTAIQVKETTDLSAPIRSSGHAATCGCFIAQMPPSVEVSEVTTVAPTVRDPSLAADMFVQVAESANDAIIITTPGLEAPHPLIVYVNPAFTRLSGYSAAEAIGQSPRMLQGPKTDRSTLDAIRTALSSGREVHEKVLNFGKGGQRYWLDLRIVPLRDGAGKITHYAAIERDVTMDKRRLDELELVADRDALTGIPNRRALLRVIDSEIAAMRSRCIARPDGKEACLAYIDVDHFKKVNDAHGHGAGDAVLLGLADRLTENLRRSDTLGRMGGEEFALWMPGVTLRDAKDLVDRLRRVIADEPFDTPAGPVTVTISIGVTAFQAVDNLVHLMHRADMAMYSAKQAGRNRTIAVAESSRAGADEVEP